MSFYEKLRQSLIKNPKIFLITGVAGFIGSNLLEELLSLNQTVIGLDNFSTGSKKNLEQVKHQFLPKVGTYLNLFKVMSVTSMTANGMFEC